MRPLAIDLFAGSFGWSTGLVAEGWRCVGFDIAHEPHHGDPPEHCDLVLQDVLTLDGAQFRDAALIVASPPCQKYSWLSMPWSLSAATKCEECWGQDPDGKSYKLYRPACEACGGMAWVEKSKAAKALRRKWEDEGPDNRLFDACFRIQREASAAAGRRIPMVVENVRGAQEWVGQARANYGSFYLWGDVCQIGRRIYAGDVPRYGAPGLEAPRRSARKVPSETGRRTDVGKGARFTSRDCSSSNARKAAAARIAKIPLELSRFVGREFLP